MSFQPDPNITEFIANLARLDDGARARLKRCAGKRLAEAPANAWRVFYNALPPNTPRYHEEKYFLVATLYPLAEHGSKGSFGAALRQIRPKTDNEAQGLDRRMQVLLNAKGERLTFLLRQAVRLLGDQDVRVNWYGLLSDLLKWENRSAQNYWARDYFLKEKDRALLASAGE